MQNTYNTILRSRYTKTPYLELRYVLFCDASNQNFEYIGTWFISYILEDISVVGGTRSKQTNVHFPLKG